MTDEDDNFQIFRDRVCFMLSNRLTYPKALLSIARDRPLTEEETAKAFKCFEECVRFVEAEILLFKNFYGRK